MSAQATVKTDAAPRRTRFFSLKSQGEDIVGAMLRATRKGYCNMRTGGAHLSLTSFPSLGSVVVEVARPGNFCILNGQEKHFVTIDESMVTIDERPIRGYDYEYVTAAPTIMRNPAFGTEDVFFMAFPKGSVPPHAKVCRDDGSRGVEGSLRNVRATQDAHNKKLYLELHQKYLRKEVTVSQLRDQGLPPHRIEEIITGEFKKPLKGQKNEVKPQPKEKRDAKREKGEESVAARKLPTPEQGAIPKKPDVAPASRSIFDSVFQDSETSCSKPDPFQVSSKSKIVDDMGPFPGSDDEERSSSTFPASTLHSALLLAQSRTQYDTPPTETSEKQKESKVADLLHTFSDEEHRQMSRAGSRAASSVGSRRSSFSLTSSEHSEHISTAAQIIQLHGETISLVSKDVRMPTARSFYYAAVVVPPFPPAPSALDIFGETQLYKMDFASKACVSIKTGIPERIAVVRTEGYYYLVATE